MIKSSRYLVVLALIAALTGCGNGFEGEYKTTTGSSIQLLNDVAAMVAADGKVVIGRDYIDADGQRTQFEKIFVRESGSERYLVFRSLSGEEDVWKIIDDRTLVKGNGLMQVTLTRIQ